MSQPDALIGTLLAGQFRIQRLLGSGGMGAVYLADQLGVGRQIVIKLMHPNLGDHGLIMELEERFQREARLVAQLNHPNLVDLYTFGRAETGQLYLAMEYVPGRTLRQVLRDEGALPELRVLELMDQMCSALHEAHAVGIIHRDLKPDNVMLTQRRDGADLVKVLDFGIARPTKTLDKALTATGAVFGTPQYMAPEQVRARAVDERTDVYALGLIAYELLTGTPPFEADSAVDLWVQHVSARVVPPSERRRGLRLTPNTEQAIARCLEKDPAGRFANTLELQTELRYARQLLGNSLGGTQLEPGNQAARDTAAAAGQAFPPQPQTDRRPRSAGVGRAGAVLLGTVLLGAVLLGAVGWILYGPLHTPHAPLEQASASLRIGHDDVQPTDRTRPPDTESNTGVASPSISAELAGIQRKHQACVSLCFNQVTELGYKSRARYHSWVSDDDGPSLQAPQINGVYPSMDPEVCARALAPVADQVPPLPVLDAALQSYSEAAAALYEITQQASRYYEQRAYQEDNMQRGRQLHQPLLAAYAAFATASQELASGIDEVSNQLRTAYGETAAPEERRRFEADLTARNIALMANLDWRDIQKVNRAAFRSFVKRYEQLLNQSGKPSISALSFLASAKAFARRVQRPNWSSEERASIEHSGSAWRVNGSPSDLLQNYNALEPLFPAIARRNEIPIALDIDPL